MIKRILYPFLILLLILDIGYSFNQYYHSSLDGDMAENIVPSPDYEKVLKDPFAIDAAFKKKPCAAPNRFFAHWSVMKYFKTMPFILQSFSSPIDSVYLSCALAKIGLHMFIIFLIALYVTRSVNFKKADILIVCVLISPLFQASGYCTYMGIIDPSVNYTFFYALPLSLCLLFFLPFYTAEFNFKKTKLNLFFKIMLACLAVILAFNGPIIPGIVLVICPMVLVYKWYVAYKSNKHLPGINRIFTSAGQLTGQVLFFFILISVLCIYSLYAGTFNTDGFKNPLALKERFIRIPIGLYYLMSQKPGFPILFAMLFFNTFLIKKYFADADGKKIIRLFKWIGIFSLIYILLLPFGGYRIYRPNILRYDTIMPITIALIFIYGLSTLFLIKRIHVKFKWCYIVVVAAFMLNYTIADEPIADNTCERASLEIIAKSADEIVLLDSTCTIMSWGKISDYKNSETNAALLQYWGVTKEKKFYYQK